MDSLIGEGDDQRPQSPQVEPQLTSERAPIGRRADWRLLVPGGPRSTTLIISSSDATADSHLEEGEADTWNWLVEDDWTDNVHEISVGLASTGDVGTDLVGDVILVRSPDRLSVALAAAAQDATVIVEMRRGFRDLRRVRSELADAGFNDERLYLATPSIDRPLRLTPLQGAAGMRWLVSLFRLNRAPLPTILDRLAGRAASLLRTPVGPMIGHQLLVANRQLSSTRSLAGAGFRPGFEELLPDGCHDAVLMTSGHDEGSRVILLPVMPKGRNPLSVVKVSSRPDYNANVDNEAAVIAAQRSATGESGQVAAAILPDVEIVFDHGALRGTKEHYAGRMTSADVCYRSSSRQVDMLRRVLEAVTDLNLAAGARSEPAPWSPLRFRQLISDPMEQYCRLIGPQAELEPLVEAITDRSTALIGQNLPLIQRHYDLGPWNIVVSDDDQLTVVDWERAEPRSLSDTGPAGADQLYFAKYWLHIAFGTQDVSGEMEAFEFLTDRGVSTGGANQSAARTEVTSELTIQFERLGINPGFVPILSVHLWLEKALYTIARRSVGAQTSPDPGDAAHYLQVLARRYAKLLEHWPVTK